jgi:hypothetical protein
MMAALKGERMRKMLERLLGSLSLCVFLGIFMSVTTAWASENTMEEDGCRRVLDAGAKKMERELEKEEERRRATYPDPNEERNFIEECLGNIYRGPVFPGFPSVPTIEDAVRDFCREMRREMGSKSLGYVGLGGNLLGNDYPLNTVTPQETMINEDIWNALRFY